MQQQLNDFLTYLASEKGVSRNTLEAYSRDVHTFASFLKEKSISSWKGVEQAHLIEFLSLRKSLGYASSSMSRHLIAIKVLFRFLKREGIIAQNVTVHLETPKMWQLIPDVLTQNEMQKMLSLPDTQIINGARDKAILELLYACGLRVSELCDLKINDVDDTFIRIVKGKGGKERVVPIGSHAIKAIDHYLGFRHDTSQEALFVSSRGKPMSRVAIWKVVKDYAKKAGITKPIFPHTFRHTCATDLLRNGADIRVIQEILGHADISSTERYTHVNADELQVAFESFHPRYT